MKKKSSKGSDRNRSIYITQPQSDEEQEIDDAFDSALLSRPNESTWSMGGKHRDHLIQILLSLGGNLGVYEINPLNDRMIQETFYKGTYALENVNGLRE